MGIIVDTNIITKSLKGDAQLLAQLWELSNQFTLILPDHVVAEIKVFCFLSKNPIKANAAFENIIDQLKIEKYSCTDQIWEIAAEKFVKYLKNRDVEKIQCAKCGFVSKYICAKCGEIITSRQHILTDFIIGAFAVVNAQKTLFSLDKGIYKTYFDEIKLI
jgi:predicted nucleic acid-binding protein